ncbi:hypothetical protein ACFWFF_03790 [Streptomyces sp. NPDC060223]|uniref:hypothetical protein n=1 Tax=unclassified Streptomyces TaxID=2593676 RepID=UPI003638BC52
MPTTYEDAEVPAWPVYALTVHDGGQVDASGPLVPAYGHADRASAIDTVAAAAARLGRPVRAEATEPDGTVWHLVISPEGAVRELPGGGQRTKATKKRHDRPDKPAPRPAHTTPEPAVPQLPAETDGTTIAVRTSAGPLANGQPVTAVPIRPVPSTAVAASRQPGPVAASRQLGPGTDPGTDPAEYAESLALVTKLLQTGRVGRAASLASRLDEQAAGTLGVSHPDALRIREIRARVTALSGDALGGVQLFRDVAERWHYQGEGERAEAAAARAQALWLQITDLDPALSAAVAVVRLRNQIPGEGGAALTAALHHRAWLEASRVAGGQPLPSQPLPSQPLVSQPLVAQSLVAQSQVAGGQPLREITPAGPPGRTRTRRPMPSWERPAQESRTAR